MLLLLCAITMSSLVLVSLCCSRVHRVDYRTISGVNGPLVVLENVKVECKVNWVIFLGTSIFRDCKSPSGNGRDAKGEGPSDFR